MAATRKATSKRPASKRPVVRNPVAKSKRPATRKALAPARSRYGASPGVQPKAPRLAGVGSEAVMRATGRAWDEWLTVLDRAGARTMGHKDIALMLSRKFDVPDWWSQMVTVGYEQARGLRMPGEKGDGFAANASRTVGAELEKLYDAWSDPRMRARWLLDAPVEVRRTTDGRSIRMTWTVGESSVDVNFYRKGEAKSQVQVEHSKLRNATAAKRQKAFWSEALERLKAILEK